MGNIQITKIGTIVIAALIVVGFGTLALFQYQTTTKLTAPKVVTITRTVIVTPTVAPTATPSASLHVTEAVKTDGIKLSTPAVATKGAVK